MRVLKFYHQLAAGPICIKDDMGVVLVVARSVVSDTFNIQLMMK